MTTLAIILPDDASIPARVATAASSEVNTTPNVPALSYLLTADGASIARQSQAFVSLLPAIPHDEVVVIVPVRRLSWQLVQLPRGTLSRGVMGQGDSARLRAVLEGLIEEQVLDEPAHLHVALSPLARESEPTLVAVCDRQWLKGWLQLLEQHQLAIARVVPELAPVQSAPLHVLGTAEQAWLVWAPPAAEPNPAAPVTLMTILPLSSATAELIQWPAGQEVTAEPAVAQLAEQLFGRPVTLLQQGQRWLNALDSNWDLGQFDLASSVGSRRWRKVSRAVNEWWRSPRWRAARWAAMALVLVQVLGLNTWAWMENSRLLAHKQAMRDVIAQTFPAVKYVVDAPLQMRKELAALRLNSGYPSAGDFDALLAVVADLPANSGAGGPLSMEYTGQSLRLKGTQLTASQLVDLNNKLVARGVEASMTAEGLLLQAKKP